MMSELKFVKIQDVAKVSRGVTWKSANESDVLTENSIRVYKIPHIQPNKKYQLEENPIYIRKPKTTERYILKNEDILMVGSNGNPARVGNVVLYREKEPSLFASFLLRLTAKELVDKQFLYYQVSGPLIQKAISNDSAGSTGLRNINATLMKEMDFLLPPMKEQQKIAAILSSVDEAIEKTDQIIEKTETVKKGLMQELLTKGIGHTEFKNSPVGHIPKSWNILSFKEVFDRIVTKNTVDNQNVLTISGEHGLISQLEYFNKSVSSKNLKNYIYLEKGDFAYNKSYSDGYPLGAIKRLERYDVGVVSTLYICFRLKEPYVNGFYKYYFDSPYWHKQIYSIAPEGGRSHGLLNVGVRDFFEILMPVPPIEEQNKIYKKIYAIDELLLKEKNTLSMLDRLKKGLMQQLLTGKTRVVVDR